MKRIISLISIAAVAFGLFSCSKSVEEEIVEEQGQTYSYTFAVANGDAENADAETKSLLGSDSNGMFLQWESTDELNTWALYTGGEGKYSYNNESTIDASTNPVTFTIVSYRALAKDDMVYAVYPYDSDRTDNTPVTDITIPAVQAQTGAVFNASAMPMVAEPFGISAAVTAGGSNDETSKVHFYNLGSIVEFDIYSPTGAYASENINSVSFTSTSNIAGTFSFDLRTVDASNLASSLSLAGKTYSIKSVTTNVSSFSVGDATGVANAKKVYMVLAPGSYTGTIAVTTNAARYEYSISSAKDFNRASVKRLGLNLEKDGVRKVIMNITKSDFATGGYSTDSFTKTVAGNNYDIDFSRSMQNSSHIQLEKSTGEIHNTTNLGKIISVSYTAYTNDVTVYIGKSASPSTAASTSGGKFVPKDSDTYGFFKIAADAGKYAVIDNIVIEFLPLASAGIEWRKAGVLATTGTGTINYSSSATTQDVPTLNNPNSVDVEYSSSNTAVATINTSTGELTIAGAGVTTITADFDGDSSYLATNVSYELTVTDVTMRAINKEYADTPAHGSFVTKVGGETVTSAKVGDVVTIVHTPDANYEVGDVLAEDEDSNDVEIIENTFTMPAKEVTILAQYVPTYLITVASASNGTITTLPASGTRVKAGTHVTVTADPSAGFALKTLTMNGADIKAAMAFDMPSADVTVAATFAAAVSAPSSVTLSAISGSGFTATWGDVDHEIGYDWKLSTSSTAAGITPGNTIASGSVDISNPGSDGASLSAGTWTLTKSLTISSSGTYYFYVLAVGDDGYESSDYGTPGSKVLSLSTTKSVTISTYASDHSWATNSSQYTTVEIDSYITASASSSGSYTGKYYTSSPEGWRFYHSDSGILTISASGGHKITSITITFSIKDNGKISYNSSALTSGSAVSISKASSVELQVGSTSGSAGKVGVSAISVTYE